MTAPIVNVKALSRIELEARCIALLVSLNREIEMRQHAERECRDMAAFRPDRMAEPAGSTR